MNLTPVRIVQKAPIVQRKFLASDCYSPFLVRNGAPPFQDALIHFQTLGIQNRGKIGTILRRKQRDAVVSRPDYNYGFALRKHGEAMVGRRFVAERQPKSGRIRSAGKRRAVTLEALDTNARVERNASFLEPRPQPEGERFLRRLTLRRLVLLCLNLRRLILRSHIRQNCTATDCAKE